MEKRASRASRRQSDRITEGRDNGPSGNTFLNCSCSHRTGNADRWKNARLDDQLINETMSYVAALLPENLIINLAFICEWHHFLLRFPSSKPERQDHSPDGDRTGLGSSCWMPGNSFYTLVCYLEQALNEAPTFDQKTKKG